MSQSVVLMILDGWGNAPKSNSNAISLASTPNWDNLLKNYSCSSIHTSGLAVGLPKGQMGNSEVGHMNIGAGRTVYQSLTRIQKDLNTHQFNQTPIFNKACNKIKNSSLHILGLLSPGGVHSHEDQIFALIKLAKSKGINNIYLHAFLDGRDVPPRSALSSIEKFQSIVDHQFKIQSIVGRYYAMDRDKNWDRTEDAYKLICNSESKYTSKDALEAVQQGYSRNENDEFIQPTLIGSPQPIKNNDTVIFMNFRADRARQLSERFIGHQFDKADRPNLEDFITLTQYQSDLAATVVYPPNDIANGLGEIISKNQLKQLRLAETEKYAHVTYFFNGGKEKVFKLEDRILIPSPEVATYDLKPEMSADTVTKKLIEAIKSKKYTFICVNYANPDMVGHTGKLDAAIKAVECIDNILGKVSKTTLDHDINLIITADHGNVEQMIDPKTNVEMTSHTKNTVPLLLVNKEKNKLVEKGTLSDIAPTVLSLLNISQPNEMTGSNLIF